MKRKRRVILKTNRRIRIVLQVNVFRGKLKRGYETLTIGSVHDVVDVPSDRKLFGEFIMGSRGYPVWIYSHELQYLKPNKIKRTRTKPAKKLKIKRRRTKRVSYIIKRRRTK